MLLREVGPVAYIKIFIHHADNISTPRSRTLFLRTNAKQLEFPKKAVRNTKASIFQKGSASFKARIDLNRKSASR
jgi:hypothetical protein